MKLRIDGLSDKLYSQDILWNIPDPEGFIYSGWFEVFRYFTVVWYVHVMLGIVTGALLEWAFNPVLTRFSHISLTLSLARIFLPGHRYRLWALSFVVVLFLLYLTSVFIGSFSCPGSPTWWKSDFDHCVLPSLSNKAASTIFVAISKSSFDNPLSIFLIMIAWLSRRHGG